MTVLGTLPIDWEVSSIQDCFQKNEKIKIGPFGSQLKKEYLLPRGDYYVYGQENVYQDDFHICYRFLSFQRFNSLKSCEIKPGDFVVSTMGTIGKCAVVPDNAHIGIMDSHLVRMRFNDSIYKPFFAYLFRSKIIQDQIRKLSVGGIMEGLSTSILKKIDVIVPPIQEQIRIASALSSIDILICSLNEAITKKRQIKEGLMQQLLTGKTRLPGFTDDWVELRFDDFISRFATGLNPRSNFVLNVNASNYYITIKDFADGVLYFDQCDKVSDEAIKRINERSDLRKGDVLFSSIGRVGDAYVIEETPNNWNINESVFSLRPNTEIIDSHFLYYLIKSKDVQAKFQESITGTTLRSIKMGHLKEIVCCFPSSISEQREIAKTLKSMDMEILSSESLREKYRLIKQGMMQELLTGKTRL